MRYGSRQLIARLVLCAAPLFTASERIQGQDANASSEAELGKQTFSACAACHGLDGRGGEHAPNIATDPTVQRMSDSAILTIVRNGIPAAGMPGFAKLLEDRQIQAVLKYLRVLQGNGPSAHVSGNESNGRDLFYGRAGCGTCHMVNGAGGFLGADLSSYGSGHSTESIRESIVAPEKNQDIRHGTVTVLTRSGKRYRGIVRNEDNFSLQMQTADGSLHLLDKSDLTQLTHESKPLMPSDYGSKLSPSELNDLISFLSQTGTGSTKPENDEDQ